MRANVALHGAWYLGGTTFDGLIGQSYRTNPDNLFPEASGLHDQVSDVVARASFAPTSWLNLTYRTRLDHENMATRFADALASVGVPRFLGQRRLHLQTFNPYTLFDQPPPPPAGNAFFMPRNEVTVGDIVELGKIPVQRLDAARYADRARWSRWGPTRSTKTNVSSLISGPTALYLVQRRQRSDNRLIQLTSRRSDSSASRRCEIGRLMSWRAKPSMVG